MSWFKGDGGTYETDIRRRGFPRVRLSLRTTKKDVAAARYTALLEFLREQRERVPDLLAGRITVEELTRAKREGTPFEQLGPKLAWPTVADAVTEYHAWLASNPRRQGTTARNARTLLQRFLAFEVTPAGAAAGAPPVAVSTLALDAVTTAMTSAYQAHELALKTPANSLTSYMGRIRALFRWHARRELVAAREAGRAPRLLHVPIDPDALHTSHTHRDVWLTEPQAEAVMARTPDALRALVALGLLAGLRIGEALHLRPGFDVDFSLGLLIIQEHPDGWKPKTKKRREVPISDDLRPLLAHHVATYASAERLFPTVTDPTKPMRMQYVQPDLEAIVTAAGLVYGQRVPQGVTFHSFRHTFASWLVQRGADLYTVAKLLGNTFAEVERTYAHLSPDHRRRAVALLAGALTIPALPAAATPAPVGEAT